MRKKPALHPILFQKYSWVLFFIFLISNSLISFGHFPLEIRLGIILMGILVPGLAAYFYLFNNLPADSIHENFLPPIPLWAWFLVGTLAVLMRFFKLTTLSVWPGYEEGMSGYVALKLFQNWNGSLFYGSSEAPRGYVWGLSFLFRILGPSLMTLWLFPALISLLTVPLGWLAARRFFSRSHSFLVLMLLALSFWPAYLGKYSGQSVLIPMWGCVALFFLGVFRDSPAKKKLGTAFILGLVVGAGFYTHVSWPALAATIGLVVLAWVVREKKFSTLGLFLLGVVIILAPLVVGALHEGFGHYLSALWAFSERVPAEEQAQISLSYLSELFWGLDDPVHSYRPIWGGFLNPILGSLFFLGLIQAVQNRSSRLNQWLLAALFLSLAPALITKSMEPFRMVPALLIVFLLCLQGLRKLLTGFKPRLAAIAAGLLLFFSFGLDFYHLMGPYQRIFQTPALWHPYLKGVEYYRAFQILEPKAKREGPGFILTDFVPGFCDETLTVADYGFNAADHADWPVGKVSWAAVMINVGYKPFLEKRFPDGKAYFLSKDSPRPNGGFMLWVMPTAGRRELLRHWGEASRALKPFIEQCLSYAAGKSFQPVVDQLAAAYPRFQGDPFLESCFWEKMADNELKVPAPDHSASIKAVREGLKLGYPSAHLFHALGTYWWMDHHWSEARQAFQRAQRAPLDLTNSSQLLEELP